MGIETKRKEFEGMTTYEREIFAREQQLLKEISGMKFSFKKLRKVLELDALVNFDR